MNDLKLELSKEILISANLLKGGSAQGYEYLRTTLGHALFFAHEDKTIFFLQHILGPIRQEVVLAIAEADKNILIEIGHKLETIAELIIDTNKESLILDLTIEVGMLIEKSWREIQRSSIGPRFRIQ